MWKKLFKLSDARIPQCRIDVRGISILSMWWTLL